jgi:putative sterol carrier protein
MKKLLLVLVLLILLPVSGSYAGDKPVFMSVDWAKSAVDVWNDDPQLTVELFKSGWVTNTKDGRGFLFKSGWVTNTKDGRGFKTMEIYRDDCPESKHVQLRIEPKDDKAVAVYGGEVFDETPDYIMWAKTGRWIEMGKGKYGPMKAMTFRRLKAMTFRRLKFKGPMWEAMKNMGAFSAFFQLIGKIDADSETCP